MTFSNREAQICLILRQNLKYLNTKAALRKEYRKRRDHLKEDQIADWSIDISNRCLTIDLWGYSLYHLFMTSEKNKEVDTSYLLSILQGKDKQPVVPKILDDSFETFLAHGPNHFKIKSLWSSRPPLGLL